MGYGSSYEAGVEQKMTQDVDVSLLMAAGGAEIVERFFNTPSEMERPNWPANLALQVYRAMCEAGATELQMPSRTTSSAPREAMQASDRAH